MSNRKEDECKSNKETCLEKTEEFGLKGREESFVKNSLFLKIANNNNERKNENIEIMIEKYFEKKERETLIKYKNETLFDLKQLNANICKLKEIIKQQTTDILKLNQTNQSFKQQIHILQKFSVIFILFVAYFFILFFLFFLYF